MKNWAELPLYPKEIDIKMSLQYSQRGSSACFILYECLFRLLCEHAQFIIKILHSGDYLAGVANN